MSPIAVQIQKRRQNPNNALSTDDTTMASIWVCEYSDFLSGPITQINNLTTFSYTSNVLQISDPFSVTVPDPRGEWIDKLKVGNAIKFFMKNQSVAGGQSTPKVTGVITNREVTVDNNGGTVIRITGADLGWHLMNNDAPLWFSLAGVQFEKLLNASIRPQDVFNKSTDPGWGFAGVRLGNIDNRNLKTTLKFPPSQAYQMSLATPTTPIWVLVEPGMKIADLLITFARRQKFLIGISADGWLQMFLPDYDQPVGYHLKHYRDDRRNQNNVKSAKMSDDLGSIWTDVTVVGERPFLTLDQQATKAQSVGNPTFGKFRGYSSHHDDLKFRHQITFSEAEMQGKTQADARALWKYQRGKFDAHTIQYTVRGHYQGGVWWESDMMCDVDDDVLNIHEPWYVSAVTCQRDMNNGDTSTVTLKPSKCLGPYG